jgi:adenine phosphoribosyltransferase
MKLEKELRKNMKQNSGYLIPSNPELYKEVVKRMIKPFRKKSIDKIMAIDMKGIMYGVTIAYRLGLSFVPIIKGGEVNKKFVIGKTFRDYSKKEKSIEIGKITINKGDKILLVDDVFESGETGKAAIYLIEKLGGKIIGISIIYDKLNKRNEDFFKGYNLHYLIKLK